MGLLTNLDRTAYYRRYLDPQWCPGGTLGCVSHGVNRAVESARSSGYGCGSIRGRRPVPAADRTKPHSQSDGFDCNHVVCGVHPANADVLRHAGGSVAAAALVPLRLAGGPFEAIGTRQIAARLGSPKAAGRRDPSWAASTASEPLDRILGESATIRLIQQGGRNGACHTDCRSGWFGLS
jgi:hypothetical protein